MIRVVSYLEGPDEAVLMARFELVDGVVRSEIFDPDFHQLTEGWPVTPADGRAFMEHLDRAFVRSSRVIVEPGP